MILGASSYPSAGYYNLSGRPISAVYFCARTSAPFIPLLSCLRLRLASHLPSPLLSLLWLLLRFRFWLASHIPSPPVDIFASLKAAISIFLLLRFRFRLASHLSSPLLPLLRLRFRSASLSLSLSLFLPLSCFASPFPSLRRSASLSLSLPLLPLLRLRLWLQLRVRLASPLPSPLPTPFRAGSGCWKAVCSWICECHYRSTPCIQIFFYIIFFDIYPVYSELYIRSPIDVYMTVIFDRSIQHVKFRSFGRMGCPTNHKSRPWSCAGLRVSSLIFGYERDPREEGFHGQPALKKTRQ